MDLSGPQDLRTPRELHPLFFGSYDWHSCVHAYWMLARLLHLYPDMAPASEIRALFDRQITTENVAGECAFLERATARAFERPYGWAWLLKLAEGLRQLEEPRWSRTLQPIVEIFVARFHEFLPKATYPVRTGTHFNSAFALALVADYAAAADDAELAIQHGVSAIQVSNHGGRQLDGVQATVLATIFLLYEVINKLNTN